MSRPINAESAVLHSTKSANTKLRPEQKKIGCPSEFLEPTPQCYTDSLRQFRLLQWSIRWLHRDRQSVHPSVFRTVRSGCTVVAATEVHATPRPRVGLRPPSLRGSPVLPEHLPASDLPRASNTLCGIYITGLLQNGHWAYILQGNLILRFPWRIDITRYLDGG